MGPEPEPVWPETERRRYERIPLEIPVLYALVASRDTAEAWEGRGLTRSLSEGGVDLEIPEFLSIGAPIRLCIPTKDGRVEVPGSIIWAESGPTLGDRVHGMGLGPWEGEAEDAWVRFIAVARQEALRRPVRFAVDLPVSCSEEGSPEVVSGRIADASTGGLLLLLPVSYPVGSRLAVDVSASVAWSEGCRVRVVRIGSAAVGEPHLYPHGCGHLDPEIGRLLLLELLLARLR